MRIGKAFDNLKNEGKKGYNGTILVIGGSEIYTGAALFSAKAALRSGSDLVFIMCPESVKSAFKSLHEAAVIPFSFPEYILSKITVCIVGPGLGRIQQSELEIICKVMKFLNNRGVPFVIDADGLHYYKEGLFNFVNMAVLTPNYKEKKDLKVKEEHICIYKDLNDMIIYKNIVNIVFNKGSLKRCGGQGDMLTGILGTALSILWRL